MNTERVRLLDTAEMLGDFGVEVFATNCGRSPAHMTYAFVSGEWLDSGKSLPKQADWSDMSDDPEADYKTSRWVLPDQKVSVGWEDPSHLINDKNSPDLKARVLEGKTVLWVFGRFRYEDTISGDHYESRFCYRISFFLSGKPMILGGGPPEYTNVFKVI